MTNVSIKNIAKAIYESSHNKEGEYLEDNLKRAVDLIHGKHLLNKSKEILCELSKIIDKNSGVVRAKISSKIKIDKKMSDEIESFIKDRYKAKSVILDFETNEKLLGGIKIQVGDEIIDETFKNKLRKLENYLITN